MLQHRASSPKPGTWGLEAIPDGNALPGEDKETYDLIQGNIQKDKQPDEDHSQEQGERPGRPQVDLQEVLHVVAYISPPTTAGSQGLRFGRKVQHVDDGQGGEEDDQHAQDPLPDDGGLLTKAAQEEPNAQGSQPERHQVHAPAEALPQPLEPPVGQDSLAGREHAQQR